MINAPFYHIGTYCVKLAEVEGIEPSQMVLETIVLPLYDTSLLWISFYHCAGSMSPGSTVRWKSVSKGLKFAINRQKGKEGLLEFLFFFMRGGLFAGATIFIKRQFFRVVNLVFGSHIVGRLADATLKPY